MDLGEDQAALVTQAETQTKLLKSLLFRADLFLVLTLLALVLSLAGAFR